MQNLAGVSDLTGAAGEQYLSESYFYLQSCPARQRYFTNIIVVNTLDSPRLANSGLTSRNLNPQIPSRYLAPAPY